MKEDIPEIKLSKSQRTKKKIEETYLNMMLKEKWDRITVKDLCEAAEITRGTFYQHYDDIYDLMEQIQKTLLDELEESHSKINLKERSGYLPENFETDFDYTPPEFMDAWFLFCRNHRLAMLSLTDPKFGDPYFVGKVKAILVRSVNRMMDNDKMPNDGLRSHFLRIFTEMHFLSVRTWLSDEDEDFLSREEILNLLNTMRVGANYLSYKRSTCPDFSLRMALQDDY